MKLRRRAVGTIGALAAFVFVALAQQTVDTELKHLTVPIMTGDRPVVATALSIERGSAYPSAIQLRGSVEIKTPICFAAEPKGETVCDGYMILRADEATLHEDTGKIEARGNVTVSPHERAK
jgi:hypothetical protein